METNVLRCHKTIILACSPSAATTALATLAANISARDIPV